MSIERKQLKILSIVMWVIGLVTLGGAIHGFMQGKDTIIAAFLTCLSLFSFYAGWSGIKGANTPSQAKNHPKFLIIIVLVVAIWISLILTAVVDGTDHGKMMSIILTSVLGLDALLGIFAAKKVADQVSL